MSALSAVVAAQKKLYGISTVELGQVLEMSPGNVNKIIREGTISYNTLQMLANYLHFTDEQKKQVLTN